MYFIMCGILGLLFSSNILSLNSVANQLNQLTHRGHDGYGIAVIKQNFNDIRIFREIGRIKKKTLPNLTGFNLALGHTRYQTMGPNSAIQPLSKNALILLHNGQVKKRIADDNNNNNNMSDSEELLEYLDNFNWLQKDLKDSTIFSWIQSIHQHFSGSYSCILYHTMKQYLIIFRDPRGIRPLSYNFHKNYVEIASETVALTNKKNIKDVAPGECIILKNLDNISFNSSGASFPNISPRPCLFEYFYLAHPKSILNGIKIKTARKLFGRKLAIKIKRILTENILNIPDVVIPIPETSCISAYSLAKNLNIDYLEALIKVNPKRTFILSGQSNRENAIRKKFALKKGIEEYLQDKNVLLVDDSIIRGTTLKFIIKMLKSKCHMKTILIASLAPPVLYPNYYGIDISNNLELLAVHYKKNYHLMALKLQADNIIYQNLEDMIQCLHELNPKIENYETSVFTGKYL